MTEDSRPAGNSALLQSKRSLISVLDSKGGAYMCKTYGADERFVIFFESDQRTNWILDTFNGTKKYLSSTVCGIVHTNPGSKRYWFNGNFNIDFVLHIDAVKYLGELSYTRTQPTTLNAYLTDRSYTYTVDLTNGILSEVKVADIPHDLWSPIVRDGKLFGFPVDENTIVNTKTLYEISLIDGSKTEHKVKEEIDVEIRNSLMKWERTNNEVDGRIESMTLTDGLLIVYAFNWNNELEPFGYAAREKEFNEAIYRFQYETVDSLSNLAWLLMQRHSFRNPSFHDFFLSKVPKTHRLCPLWDSRKND
ncbi:hypothetical protein M3Y98_00544300 [Aphelenchoides besseyi]|nr:hypothetical protein M3Y98_00544300 [Aphelenchoides besseyi]